MAKTQYHHGDLPSALRTAAAELVSERGPTGFSLREVARRAGCSHAAPAHHFGDSRGLLASVALEGFTALAERMEAATAGVDDPRERLRAMGVAYISVAREKPGHFGVMMTDELWDDGDTECKTASMRAYSALVGALEYVRDRVNPDLDVIAASTLAWASMHGLVELSASLVDVAATFGAPPPDFDQLVSQFTDLMMDGFSQR